MKLPQAAFCALITVALLVSAGCGAGVVYYGDATPKMEATRHEYVRTNPDNRFNEDILEGRVQTGMSRLQVRVAWGEPDRVKIGDRAGIDQVWTYEEDVPSRGESFYEMRFHKGVLHEIAMTRGTPNLISIDSQRDVVDQSTSAGAKSRALK